MQLRLAVEAQGQPEREVTVDVQPGHRVAELLVAIQDHLELDSPPGALALYSRRDQAWLDGEREIGGTGLRSGDRVVLGDPSAPVARERQYSERDALVDLYVMGGPSAGVRVPLPAGEHRVGSHRYSGVMLADPSLARVHLLVEVSPIGVVSVFDPGSEAGTFVEGERVAHPTRVQPGQLVACGRTLLTFRPHADETAVAPPLDAAGRIAFNRPPRVAQQMPSSDFRLEAPPRKEKGGRLPLSTALVPLGMGAAMYLIGQRQTYYLLFMLLSPIMAVFSLLETRVGGRRGYRRASAGYRERIHELENEMAQSRAAEAAHLQAMSPDVATLLHRARTLDPALWERRQDSPDWLVLRVGWGDRPSSISLEVAPGGEDELRDEANEAARRQGMLRAAPMLVSLPEAGVLGLSGDGRLVAALARCIGLQLATLHSPEDLVLAAAMPPGDRRDWAWLDWLPHVTSDSAPVAGPLVVAERTAARALIDRLLALVHERREVLQSFHGTTPDRLGPSIVAFLHEEVELPRGAVATLLEQGPKVGVHAIWLGRAGHALPGECGAIVELRSGEGPRLTLPRIGRSTDGGGADGMAADVALEAARALAPVRDVSSRESAAGIPRRVNLMELLGLEHDIEGRLLQNWIRDRFAPEERQLTATWGMGAAGEPFAVSLRLHGPHALVGGMTGSGKSELLQSLVASLAAAHSPRSLNLLLVDYKGGAAFKDCVDLPHTVGFVTDLDGHLVNRALVSLRAELRRREHVLREAGAKDLLDLERRAPDRTPASLLIVVDEFAALAAELPEFVDGMVDVAQRGRSLGIHLLLATQRPQGVINDRIRANMNLRVSLRFSDEAESLDVVGSRDAARPGLPPGRAFARTGPGEVTEFQAGYVGGHTAWNTGPAPVLVHSGGRRQAPAAGPAPARAPDGEPETDLMRLVRGARAVNEQLALPPSPRPWLPTLPELLPLESLPAPRRGRGTIGLLDDPNSQRQDPLDLDLEEDGNLLVFGSSGSGKTMLLRTLAVSFATSMPSRDLHIYALDFATRGLRPLEALPHCGGVIGGDDTERAVRLLRMLVAEANRRRELLAASGASTLGEHMRAGGERLPRILVLLDGFASFVSTFENVEVGVHIDSLRTLVAEGRPLGIAFAISVDRHVAFVSALSASVLRRVILRMATDDEYTTVGLARSVYADAHLPPGRGFTERGQEVHCAMVGTDPAGSAQAAAIARLAAELAQHQGAEPAPPVRLLPKEVGRASLPRPGSALEAVVGIEDRALGPVRIDLEEGHFLVAGPRRSGRSTALATFAASLASAPGGPELHLLAPRRQTPLASLGVWGSVALGVDACGEAVRELAARARERPAGSPPSAVIVIDDGEELTDTGVPDLDWIAQRGREHGLRLLLGAESQAAQRAFSAWLTQVLRERQGILLDPDPALDGSLVGGVALPRRTRGTWPVGRAYLVRRGTVELIQVAM